MKKPEEFLQIGVITTTHGLKGEVKVYPTTDDPNRFKDLDRVFLSTSKEQLTLHVATAKVTASQVILRFKEFSSIEEVEGFRKCPLFVAREDAVDLSEDEYFIADLIGMDVYDESDEKIGILSDVIQTAANDVYVIKLDNGSELLLPAIHECILSVNPDEGKMTVHPLPEEE